MMFTEESRFLPLQASVFNGGNYPASEYQNTGNTEHLHYE